MATKLFSTHPNTIIWFIFHELIIFYLIAFPVESMAQVQGSGAKTAISIGVIVDESTRVGREQMTALYLAANNFNQKSDNLTLSLLFRNSSCIDPLQAAYAAIELYKEHSVKAIIGMETWQEAALVAEVGSQYQIPVVSLAPAAPSTSTLASQRWPSLVQMSTNYPHQIGCIAAMIKYYGWTRVVVVYEDDGYAGTSMSLSLVSQALQDSGSSVEYYLPLPPISVVNESAKDVVLEQVLRVLGKQSRVFVVLGCSLPVAAHLFKEANRIGLLGRETVWIVTESIAGLLDTLNSTSIYDMQGVLGIKSYYDEATQEFLEFMFGFSIEFRSRYSQEDYSRPSIYALRAYDGITTIADAIGTNSKQLLEGILASNSDGLTGKISFNKQGELETVPVLRVVNVVGKMYKDLDLWTAAGGFYKGESSKDDSLVDWPGDVRDHIPRGWAMPTDAKPLRIGVPGMTSFEKFVKVELGGDPNRTTYSGFCIDVFLEAVKILEQTYTLPYEFHAFYGTYDELVDCVYNKTFDAVVGDVTILAERSKKVEFTQPYAKSGLWTIVPYKSKESQKAWLFTKPFTWNMWMATGAVMVYTMFIVWLLEHKSNPEFGGSWKDQLRASLWFTFCSIFFMHQEKTTSKFTRIAVMVWIAVVFVLTSSYTASLTSMLTVPIMEPTITNISSLQINKTGQQIGCDGDSFVLDYLTNVLHFSPENIVNITSQYEYPDKFNDSTIVAAFLEAPYARVFLDEYCKDFTQSSPAYRFGGLGFAFQKGSPIAADVSKAIMQLSENGVLKSLDDKWFMQSSECANANNDTERLSFQAFWVIYLFSGATSTICVLLFVFEFLRSYSTQPYNVDSNDNLRSKLARLARFYDKGMGSIQLSRPETATRSVPGAYSEDEWVPASPPIWDYSPTPSNEEERSLEDPSEIELSLRPSLVVEAI